MARPLVRLLGRIRIGKWQIPVSLRALVTLIAIWAIFFGFFRLFIPLIANEAQELSNIDTELVIKQFEEPIHRLELRFNKLNLAGEGETSLREELQSRIGSVLNIRVITDLVATIASILGNLAWAIFAISFITFFLLREERLISEYIVTLFPKEKESAFRHALDSVKHLLRRYFVGILLQMTGILILVTVGMTIVGVGFRHGLVIGLLAAVLNIIPYLGPWIGAALGITLGVATHLSMDFATELIPLIGIYDTGVCHYTAHRQYGISAGYFRKQCICPSHRNFHRDHDGWHPGRDSGHDPCHSHIYGPQGFLQRIF